MSKIWQVNYQILEETLNLIMHLLVKHIMHLLRKKIYSSQDQSLICHQLLINWASSTMNCSQSENQLNLMLPPSKIYLLMRLAQTFSRISILLLRIRGPNLKRIDSLNRPRSRKHSQKLTWPKRMWKSKFLLGVQTFS